VEALLDVVDEHHKTFDFIHVSTAVTRVAKLAKVTRDVPLASDERYAKLMGLVVQQLSSFDARGVVNVCFGLATLQVECRVTADAELLVQLGAAMERVAPDMNAQGVANTLNAYSKLEEAAAEMPRSLWGALAQAAERVDPNMNAQDVAIILNAYSKLEEAAAEMPRSLRDALAKAAERVAPNMNARDVANTLNAY
jgi:acetylornithine deacetylase/succinyl-diaminopimelate desuccinylase-like protein